LKSPLYVYVTRIIPYLLEAGKPSLGKHIFKMDVKSLVPRLEQLAFTVSFEEILGNLYLCPDHCQKEKQFGQNIQFASLLPPKIRNSLTSENILNFVRKRLNYHLVGLVSDTTRYILLLKFVS